MSIKVLGNFVLASIVILVGGVLFLAKPGSSLPEDQIISQNGLHWHTDLAIYIKGQKQEIPQGIGLGAIEQPIRTHDTSGKIHTEYGGIVKKDDLKIWQFFKIWGKEFNKDCIFDRCSGPDGKVKMLINGQESREFENYQMRDGDKVEIRYE